jgi:signal transduction histidine kinase/integral membrane sensor domain MASE1
VLRYVLLVGLTVGATLVGYESLDPDLQVALIWPLYGVAVLWLVSGSRRSRPWDVLALAGVSATTLALDEASWQRVAVGSLQTVVVAVVFLAAVSRLTRGRTQLDQPLVLRHVVIVCVATLVSALVAAALRFTGLGLLPPLPVDAALLLVVRNTSGILVAVVPGLLLLHRLRSGRSAGQARTWGRALVETVALVAAATALALVVFTGAPVPLSFALVLLVVVAAFRVPPAGAVAVATVVGLIAVLATLDDQGTFVLEGRPFASAAIAQGFLITVVVAALAISVGVEERERAVARALVAERMAEGRAELVERVISNISDGISVITADGDYVVRNPASLELSGPGGFRDPEVEEPDQPSILDLDGGVVPADQMPWRRVLAGEDPVRETLRARWPDGSERVLRVVAHRTDVGLPEPAVTTSVHDITQETEERDQLVSFAGVVAHDLKNPLTVIRGWSESLQEELAGDRVPDVATLRSMVDRVVSASDAMRGFIDDLLGMTVARDRQLELEVLDLTALTEEVAELRRSGETRPRITVQPGLCVTGDRFLVRQLLDNLVANAVKYVAPEVRPSVSVTGVEAHGMLEVTVADNGIGIPPESRERVFQPLVRAQGAAGYSGTGLGLAICRRVVERHGGRIWVDRDVGRGAQGGTAIHFTLPAAPGAP